MGQHRRPIAFRTPWYAPSVVHPGDILDGKYRVVRLLGEGGMGAVYEGRNLRLDRPVAIKLMHKEIARDTQAVARFEREAQAAARIGSRHIVDVLDLGELPDGDRYMVMEYLDGETLAARLKRVGTLSVLETAKIGLQLLEGLTKVHEAGIVHRDLKPPNIFLVRDEDNVDFVKILDFGVCKIERSKAENGPSTGIGDVLGTLGYMAPEQLEFGPAGVDARADLYAIGVLLYRAVSGRLPYGAKSLIEHLSALRERNCAPLSEVVADADPKFSEIVERAIEWDPGARFQNARTLQRALAEWVRANEGVNRLLADFLDVEPVEATPSSQAPKLAHSPPAPVTPGSFRPPTAQPDADSLAPTKRVHGESSRPPSDGLGPKPPPPTPPPRRHAAGPAREPMPSLSELATGKLPQKSDLDFEVDVEIDYEPGTGKT